MVRLVFVRFGNYVGVLSCLIVIIGKVIGKNFIIRVMRKFRRMSLRNGWFCSIFGVVDVVFIE